MSLTELTILAYLKWCFIIIVNFLILNVSCQSLDFESPSSNPSGGLGTNQRDLITYSESVEYVSSNFSYFKCFCSLQEVWKDGSCLPAETDIVFPLLQSLHSESTILFSFIFSTAIVKDITCSEGKVLLNLKNDNLFLLENGDLYSEETDLIIPEKNYCFEFIEEHGVKNIIAKICIDPPSVPICRSQHNVIQDISFLNINVSFGYDGLHSSNLSVQKIPEPNCGNKTKIVYSTESKNNNFSFYYLSNHIELLWQPPFPAKTPQVFYADEYCLFKNDSNGDSFLTFCYDDPQIKHDKLCSDFVCVRKCCPQNQIYNTSLRSCSPYKESSNGSLFSFYDYESQSYIPAPQNVLLEYSFPWCQNDRLYIIDPKINPTDKFFLLENGSLYISLSKLTMPPSLYCVDEFLDSENMVTVKAISCFLDKTEATDKCQEIHRILYPVLIVISCLFLSITLTVYSVIPELHTKLHGKSLLSHVFSLLMAFLCQLLVVWVSKSLSMTGCKIIALGNQVSFLWAFFWLNVMCFDIWWTLKTMSPVPETGESSKRRFALYSIYAWGCPAVICFLTALMEFLPQISQKSHLILPGFGVRGCWFQDVKSTWIYFHGFTLSLYVLNIFFFFHVAAILIRGQRSTEGILRTTRKQHKERVYLYLKLFVIMGITWICEVASWQEGTCEYWIFTDIVNSFQGVMIFFIFMWNKKVFQKVKARSIPICRRLKAIFHSPSSGVAGVTRVNSSSQRTQTSDELSLRRLSSSVLPQSK